jgi:hypothetical protein
MSAFSNPNPHTNKNSTENNRYICISLIAYFVSLCIIIMAKHIQIREFDDDDD